MFIESSYWANEIVLIRSKQTSSIIFVPQNLRQQILELLGPISMNHGAHFMAAIAYVWNERKQVKAPVRNKVGVVKGLLTALKTI